MIVSSGYNQLTNAQDPQNKIRKSTIYFGCEVSSTLVHCDRLHNKFESYKIQSNSTTLYQAEAMPVFVRGKEGSAIQMYANHRQSIIFSNTTEVSPKQFSIAFWIKGTKLLDNTNSPNVGHVVSQYNDQVTAGWSFSALNLQNLHKESISFVVYNDQGQAFSPPDVPIFYKNRFVHIVGTFDGSNLKIYRDGTFFGKAKFEGSYNYHSKYPLTLGVSSARPLQSFGTGSVDDLRYYDRVISTDEIKQIYNREEHPANTTSKDLIGHWKFNGNLNDNSGNNHHGRDRTLITSMVFAPDGRLFFSEKDTGHIKVMKNEKVNSKPFATISDYYSNWEQGLLGLAIDPDFKENHFIYLFYTSVNKQTGNPFNRIIRFTDVDSNGKNKVVIFDNIPASKGYHSGGAMAFGPDNKLYVTIGDATQNTGCGNLPNSTGAICPAQDPSSQLGKVLRINRDGSIPKDNPYPDSPVFNVGHLNMYGIAFDESGFGLVSENGRFHYDEINTIERAINYGSPTIQIPDSDPETSTNSRKPLRSYYDAKCLTSLIFYNGDKISQLKGKFLVGTFKSESPIYALQVDNGSKQIVGELAIFLNNFLNNQVVALAQSPTGEIYYASYEINKLDSVNSTKKMQTLFPIEMNYSSPIINITHLSFNPSKTEITMDVDSGITKTILNNGHNINSEDSIAYLTVTIPKELLHQIDNVTSTISNLTRIQTEIIDFTIQDLPNSNDTIVNISFKDKGHYRLFISGKSSHNQSS
jgi:glucose/arabinose dehydrogenase